MLTTAEAQLPVTLGIDKTRLAALAATELNVLAPLVYPDTCYLPFPDYYRSLYVDMMDSFHKERTFDKYALGFPRGHSKTLFAKLLAVSAVANTQLRFILIVGATDSRAQDFLADVASGLDEPNFRATYGNWREDLRRDTMNVKQFMFQGRMVQIAAIGQGSSLRGLSKDNARPDLMIMDDAQTRECAESVAESTAFQKWFYATLLKAKSPIRCTYLYIGNMYRDIKITDMHYACLMRNLQLSPYWRSYITGAILANGTALWEELQPLQQLLLEYQEDTAAGQGEVFAAEVQNDPTYKPKSTVDTSLLRVRDAFEGELHQGDFIIIDPAGRKTGGSGKRISDKTAILYGRVFDGVPYAYTIHAAVMTPLETIEYAIGLALKHGCSVIGAESTAYQETLLYWMDLYCRQHSIEGIDLVELYTGRRSKNERILESFGMANRKEIGFVREAVTIWLSYVMLFDPKKTDNIDDVLDVVWYMQKMYLQYGQHMSIAGESTVVQYTPEHDALPASYCTSSF